MDTIFSDHNWQSADGLTLHFRDYPGDETRPAVLCLHGLTRNARDFEDLAAHIAEQGWRVIVPDMRGRGESEYASDSASYALPSYVDDLTRLLDQLGVGRVVAIGTSMGGLMIMLLAAQRPELFAAVVLNDVGPVVESEGLERIRTYVGQGRNFPTWVHGARALAELHGEAHPDFGLDDWLTMAKRTLTLCSNGRIAFDYDMKIAEPILAAEDLPDSETSPAPDLWPMIDALKDKPAVLVRGALSNILSAATLERMQHALPRAQAVTIARAGHAPTLDEPEVRAAIDRLLQEVS
ncbi:MAG: alpha/beta hydrolase [Sphingomonadaceae bacterium]